MGEERNLVIRAHRDVFGQYTMFFASPAALLERVYAYFEAISASPLYVSEQIKGSKGKEIMIPCKTAEGEEDIKIIPPEHLIEIPRKRAASHSAIALWCGVSKSYFAQMKIKLREGTMPDPEGKWQYVMDVIDDMIFAYNFEGAAAGQFNAALMARYLGITEKIEQKTIEEKTTKEVFKLGDMEFEL